MASNHTMETGNPSGVGYAESLRKQLMDDLFDGEEFNDGATSNSLADEFTLDEYLGGSAELSLQDIDKDLDALCNHEVIKGVCEQGRVMKEYARDIDEKLRQAEMESIQEYIAESDNMVALHEQISACDSILEGMEQVLGRFQSDLGRVSEEIRQLQVQSQSMSTKLKNRRDTEGKLGSFIDHLSISETVVVKILDSEVNEDYLEYLLELDKKLRFVKDDEIARSSQAKRELESALEKLRMKAVTKVREFVLQKIYMLKRPKTNVQIIQQNALLKYKYFVRFLKNHGPDVYQEVRSEYMGVMSRIMSTHFKTYLQAMERMQQPVALAVDLLGATEGATGSQGGSSGGGMLSFLNKNTVHITTEKAFELGDRDDILGQLDKPAIIPHMAEYEGKKFPTEVIFRNVHKLLMDTATSEYFFCLDFFEDESVFKELFGPIISVVESDVAMQLQENSDIVCVLLMIRINQEHRMVMAKRHVPVLDDYMDRVHIMLWPRLKLLYDNQLNSIRGGTEKVLFVESVSVHMVVRRYAALAASMFVLMSAYDQDESGLFKAQMFDEMVSRMWATMFDLLLRMGNLFRDRKAGIIFLIVNYHHLSCTLHSADTKAAAKGKAVANAAETSPSRADSEDVSGIGRVGLQAVKECEDQLVSCTSLYVEDQLMNHFPMLVEFVKKAEQQFKRMAVADGQTIPNFSPVQAAPILKDFSIRWKGAIEEMCRETGRHFQGDVQACGRDVLQASMTSLLKYYTRMLELLKRQGSEGQALVKEAVNIPSIMYEIKRVTKS